MNSNSRCYGRNTRVLLARVFVQPAVLIQPIEIIENRLAENQREIPYMEFLKLEMEFGCLLKC